MVKSNIERRNWEYRFKTNGFDLHLYNSAAMFRPASDEKIKRMLGNIQVPDTGFSDNVNSSDFVSEENCESCRANKVMAMVKRK